MLARAAAILCCFVVLPGSAYAQQTRPREHFQNADVIYDWVSNSRGDRLRTFISRPRNASGKVPVLFFVGWLSCDSVESPQGETDGFSALMLRLIEQSGYATLRTEKPGAKPGGGLAKRRLTARHSRLEGHGHESRRQLGDRRNGEPRAPGQGCYVEVEGMTHGFTVEKKFQAEVVTMILNWAREQLATGQ